jgi:hypothetical protein
MNRKLVFPVGLANSLDTSYTWQNKPTHLMDKIKKLIKVLALENMYIQMTEQVPFISRIFPVEKFLEKAEKHFQMSYTEEEINFLLEMYASPLGVTIIKKIGHSNLIFQEEVKQETMSKLEALSEEERAEFLEEIAMCG